MWCMECVRSPKTEQQRSFENLRLRGKWGEVWRGLKKGRGGLCSAWHKHERRTSFSMPCREPSGIYFEPSQLKQILRSNFRPPSALVRVSVKLFSQPGTARRTRSNKSSDASYTPETQQYPLQKAVNTIHFQATDTCLFKYQRPAQMLWKTENNISRKYISTRGVEEKVKCPKSGVNVWSHWSVSQFEFESIYCVWMRFCTSGFFGRPWYCKRCA